MCSSIYLNHTNAYDTNIKYIFENKNSKKLTIKKTFTLKAHSFTGIKKTTTLLLKKVDISTDPQDANAIHSGNGITTSFTIATKEKKNNTHTHTRRYFIVKV